MSDQKNDSIDVTSIGDQFWVMIIMGYLIIIMCTVLNNNKYGLCVLTMNYYSVCFNNNSFCFFNNWFCLQKSFSQLKL